MTYYGCFPSVWVRTSQLLLQNKALCFLSQSPGLETLTLLFLWQRSGIPLSLQNSSSECVMADRADSCQKKTTHLGVGLGRGEASKYFGSSSSKSRRRAAAKAQFDPAPTRNKKSRHESPSPSAQHAPKRFPLLPHPCLCSPSLGASRWQSPSWDSPQSAAAGGKNLDSISYKCKKRGSSAHSWVWFHAF